jgi:hypothetical protein
MVQSKGWGRGIEAAATAKRTGQSFRIAGGSAVLMSKRGSERNSAQGHRAVRGPQADVQGKCVVHSAPSSGIGPPPNREGRTDWTK